jgi:DNA-binding GntR family transcriptional regulator
MPIPSATVRIRRESAGALVYGKLRDWILHGPLEPEETIHDAEIALALGVSRTPVREAIVRLEHEGLVQSASGRWTRVAPLRLDRAPELYRIVAALDGLAAAQATPTLTPEDINAMAEANRRLRRQRNGDAIHGTDRAFHDIYRGNDANTVVSTILASAGAEIDRIERAYFADPATPEASYRSHQAIIVAFEAGDAAAAAAAAQANWLQSIPRVEALRERASATGRLSRQ